MNSFADIEEKIKGILEKDNRNKKTIFGKDVAKALKLSPANLHTLRHRESIPFVAIAEFCVSREISINEILFSQSLHGDDIEFNYEILKREVEILKNMVENLNVKS